MSRLRDRSRGEQEEDMLAITFNDVVRFLSEWTPFLLVVLVGVAVGYLMERVVIRVLRRATESTETELDDIIIRAVHPALAFAAVVGSIWFATEVWATRIPAQVVVWTERLSFTIIVVLTALFAARLLKGLLAYRARKSPQWSSAASLGGRTLSAAIYVLAFLIILRSYGIEITPLLTGLGIAGLAVALALQDTLSNFFAGVWIQAGRALRPGHFVKIEGTDVQGFVVDVGWRTTQIRTLPNNLVVIPNAKLAQSTITDYHLPFPQMSLLVNVSVGYECDPERVERILVEEAKKAAEEVPGLDKEPEPFVRFIPGFGATSLDFTLIVKVREFVDQYLGQHELRKRILKRFRAEGIRIPYPIRDVYMVPATRADVAGDTPAGPS